MTAPPRGGDPPTESGPLRILLEGAIDYAGLFPPADLPMADAVRNHARYREGDDAWALGRFVLPASRVEAYDAVVDRLRHERATDGAWEVSVLVGSSPEPHVALLERPDVRAVEARADTAAEIRRVVGSIPEGVETYVEIPPGEGSERLLGVLAELGARGKIRTGGTEASSIPGPASVATFLTACVRAGIPFKATAGLHHPLRGRYPLTYEEGADTSTMFGYLNLFLATAVLLDGGSAGEAEGALMESDRSLLSVGPDALEWAGRSFGAADLRAVRKAMVSFGSCSFREPIDELAGWPSTPPPAAPEEEGAAR